METSETTVPADHQPEVRSRIATMIAVVAAVAVLYFAREIFIPFALALLFSFLLAPLVVRLRRWHFGRVPAVLCVVLLAFSAMAVIGGMVSIQLADLARDLPEYQQAIQRKLHTLHESSGGAWNRLARAAHDFSEELTPAAPARNRPGEEKPVPVEIRRAAFSPLEIIQRVLGSVISILLTAGVVIVLVVFMLFQREDLRDRLIRLVGARRLNLTTRALDDAAQRVSRYLLAQFVVNVAFGFLAGVGLYFLRVPNPILWGALAAVLRYIPYLGVWIAAAMPATVSLAVTAGWLQPLGIFGLFFGIDVLIFNLIEPLLYGSSTGISPMAVLAAAVFWTWLWGPIGLLLSTPLTVCLVVIGRYVPSLGFLSVLLGDEPVLSPEKRFYQRLLATDIEEAAEIAEAFLKGKSPDELYDQVIIPALTLAEEDRHRGKLDDGSAQSVFRDTRILIEDLATQANEFIGEDSSPDQPPAPTDRQDPEPAAEPSVLSMPARDEADEIGALMLAQLLNRRGIAAQHASASALASEQLEEVARAKIRVVCVTAVPPFGHMHARYLCKRLRVQFPGIKIVAVILNEDDARNIRQLKPQAGADETVTTLGQAVAAVLSLLPAVKPRGEPMTSSS